MISVQVQQGDEALFGGQSAPAPGSIPCPGLFYTTATQDGALLRLRTPGGLLNAQQCRELVSLSESLGSDAVDVTNRANIQIRGLDTTDLQQQVSRMAAQLMAAQLAAPIIRLDHLRNIMASPTAGIDPAQLLDSRPLVRALDAYISSEPTLAGLSPKFSIGLDGGEQVSIAQQPNDLQFTAVELDHQIYWQLDLSEIDPDFCILIQPETCVAVVAAIAQVYLLTVDPALVRKPRLRQLFKAEPDLLRDYLRPYLSSSLRSISQPHRPEYRHLGIHAQRQPEQSYIGIALPLGRLENQQLRQLANLAETYGSGTLRLTPWRNLLIPDIANAVLPTVQQQLAELGLSDDSILGGLVACSGLTGCASAATDTQADALAVAAALTELERQHEPLTIHFSGCPKSCAHRISSDMALVGDPEQASPTYSLYVGEGDMFGRLIATNLPPSELPQRLTNLLAAYDRQRRDEQSFREFVNQQPVAQLQVWLTASLGGER